MRLCLESGLRGGEGGPSEELEGFPPQRAADVELFPSFPPASPTQQAARVDSPGPRQQHKQNIGKNKQKKQSKTNNLKLAPPPASLLPPPDVQIARFWTFNTVYILK